MARSRRPVHTSARRSRNDRHGRGLRSSVMGPHLPPLDSRVGFFDRTVAETAEYLLGAWPEELSRVVFEVGLMPNHDIPLDSPREPVARWMIEGDRIVFFRLPIQRLSRLHRNDYVHRRLIIESCVFRAVAEYLGKDPWELAPDPPEHY